jgi:hypothetical protein
MVMHYLVIKVKALKEMFLSVFVASNSIKAAK